MSTIVTRSGKGSPLTHVEVDANFTNLNTDKTENATAAITGGTINGTSIGATTASTGRFSDLTDTGLTAGRVTYAGTGGNLVDSANLTFNGTSLTATNINNTAIGATTPAAGTFTTLTATSTGTFGGDATNPSLVAAAAAGSTRWLQVAGSSAGNVVLSVQGAGNPNLVLQNRSTGAITFTTNGTSTNEQMRVAHTASAVNYIQVTGAATGAAPVISVQGSDANRGLDIQAKGTGTINFGSQRANYLRVDSASASNSPVFSAQGSDTDIDLTLTPKGAGNVRFGTYTAGVLTPTGYITVKDSGGTTRRLLVG
jgi:hypothetical protein